MCIYGADLYVGTHGKLKGCEVWRYDDDNWSKVNSGGFGNANNNEISCMAVFGNCLFVGTGNLLDGCEVWRTGSVGYLAEGATAGEFETWVLVQNPGSAPVHVDFTLNTEAGEQKPPPDLQGGGDPRRLPPFLQPGQLGYHLRRLHQGVRHRR